MTPVNALLHILENPLSKKGYKELEKYLENNGLTHEAESIRVLIAKRFNANDPSTDQES